MAIEQSDTATAAAGLAAPDQGISTGKALAVLLVDDSQVFLDATSDALSRFPGCQVVGFARSGVEALARVRALSPDVVLTDLFMPGMNGLELTRQLKALPGAPKVVLVTLHQGPHCRARAFDAGADEYLPKQRFMEELPALMQKLFPPT